MADKKSIPLGDKHCGKQVELITDGEVKYLFKPRSACAERGLEAFLLTLEQEGFPFLPACEHVLEESENGFKSAFCEHLSAENDEDVELYFKRCGALIFFSYLFGSNDLHYENIIASKDTPVLIDCETLMCPETESFNGNLKSLTSSVMKSHLLPNWRVEGGVAKLTAGLISDRADAPNHLQYNGSPCYIYDYENEVLQGFKSTYSCALQHIDIVKKALDCFEGSHFRFLLRPTELYAKFIELANKLDTEKREPMVRALLSAAHQNDVRENRLEYMAKVLDEEVSAVLNGDIPCFFAHYNELDLYGNGGLLADGFFSASPKKCVVDKLNSLSVEDMTAQCRVISQSIAATRPIEKYVPRTYAGEDIYNLMFSRLEAGYVSAISAGFTQLEYGSDDNLYFQSVDFELYDGLSGILCAYAALYSKTGNKSCLNALKSHYAPLGEYIKECSEFSINKSTVSLQSGISGVIACLLHIYDLTGEQMFYSDALTLAKKLKPQINGEVMYDLLGGLAGLAVQLPKLPENISVPLAEVVLPRLAAYNPELTGAAHGAAGIALGICAAQSCLKTNDFDAKVLELLHFEEEHYNEEANNWQDLRVSDKVGFMHGWCSGVGGEAMARKSLLTLTENAEIISICNRDLERAEKNLCSDFTAKRDSLCCGNAARLTACSNLNLKNTGLYTLLCDRIKNGSLNMFHPCDTADKNYGLMQGLAGVIYAITMYGDERSGGMLIC